MGRTRWKITKNSVKYHGIKYFHTTSSYNAENPLGVIKATLNILFMKLTTLKILLVNCTKQMMETGMICRRIILLTPSLPLS
jgi:hypothetical protein